MKILILMIFLHIVDDFVLQGILINLKQKKWWKENAPDEKYKYDYIVGLIIHSMSWSFMILLPFFFIMDNILYIILFIVNAIIHLIVDDLKANKFKINLIQDQSIHILQIITTFIIGTNLI